MRSEEEIRKAIEECESAQRGGAVRGDQFVVVGAGVACDVLRWFLGENGNFQQFLTHVNRAPEQAKKAWMQ